MEKNSILQNNKVENFKNLENLWSKRDFFSFLQVISFDTFIASKLKFSAYALYWEYNRNINNQIVVGQFKSVKFYHKIGRK